MIDNLPPEIVSNIANRLSQYRLCACVLVCRSWYEAFISALYNTVDIRQQHSLTLFLEALRQTREEPKPLGHLARKLMMSKSTSFSSIACLPDLCPFVVKCDYRGEWSSDLSAIVQKWKWITNLGLVYIEDPKEFLFGTIQNSITELRIATASFVEWVDLIGKLPCIEELGIENHSDPLGATRLTVSLCEFEKLHNDLPRLRTFIVCDAMIYGELPEEITPCDKVCNLELSHIEGFRWGGYFAQKYTNLQKLDLSFVYGPEPIVLAKSCQLLQELTCYNFELELLETIPQIDAPIKNLTLSRPRFDMYANAVEGLHRTFTHIHLIWTYDTTFEEITDPLRACSLLVELQLDLHQSIIEVDRILDYWKYLTKLVVRTAQICMNSDCATTNDQHGLRTLAISGWVKTDAIFPYLSQRCPRLSSLKIYFDSMEQGRTRKIYLPNLNIKTLEIYSHWVAYIYKLIQTGQTERIQECNGEYQRSIDKDQVEGGPRWFYEDGRKFRELTYDEVKELYGHANTDTENCEAWTIDSEQKDYKLKDSIKNEELLNSMYKRHAIWIQYHYADEIFLRHRRVPCL
ncbi:hypothetical protein DFQ30_000319 [Apophysomyces sp. BC1015]|nr:hypothetical protein DFQ30_000319 [Apophysomyces sp. BC1015]